MHRALAAEFDPDVGLREEGVDAWRRGYARRERGHVRVQGRPDLSRRAAIAGRVVECVDQLDPRNRTSCRRGIVRSALGRPGLASDQGGKAHLAGDAGVFHAAVHEAGTDGRGAQTQDRAGAGQYRSRRAGGPATAAPAIFRVGRVEAFERRLVERDRALSRRPLSTVRAGMVGQSGGASRPDFRSILRNFSCDPIFSRASVSQT